ncbi:hypothetical protein AB0953_11060 [Streptomyces sp. NPDC046866]|uniref:D-alanyl-D-alanine carboxypeptidase n=1 Tax=Streptomyces sp. NPDC046866 TaxID=3154921 RepID=UPI0034547823
MVAIEEELVAGESPDKSVDEGVPGAAKSAAERDPRLSVFRPRDAQSAGASAASAASDGEGDRGAAGPASSSARTATADADTGDDAETGSAGSAGSSVDPKTSPSSGRVDSGAGSAPAPAAVFREPKFDSESGDDRGDRGAAGADPAESERTAVFRAPKFDSASAAAPKPGPDPERTAVFRAPRLDSAPARPAATERSSASDRASASDSDGPSASADEAARPDDVQSAGSGRTSAPRPAEASASASSGKAAARSDEAEPGTRGSASPSRPGEGADKPSLFQPKKAAASADSERTAVFRTVKPAAGRSDDVESAGSGRTSASRPAEASASASAGKAAERSGDVESGDSGRGSLFQPKKAAASADSERTAVFRTVKPAAGRSDDVESAGSGRTSASRPAEASASASAGKAAERSGDVESGDRGRGSLFQPKKAAAPAKPADDERTAAFRPVKPGAAGADKPSASASAPGRPAGGAPAPSGDVESADSGRASASRPGPGRPGGAGSAAAGSGSKAAAADEADGDSERTAVFRAPKPGAGAADKAAAGPAGEGKAGEGKAGEAKGGRPAGADKPVASRPVPPKSVGGEKASTFVPLRADGGPAKPAAGAARPAAASAPAPSAGLDPSERTTQQPLPPKPPLDMLADLTNNPPPPPTPMRTVVRRFKIYTPLVVLLLIILAVVQMVRPLPEPVLKMTAKSTYTFDGAAPSLPWPKEGQAYMAASGLGTVGTFGEQKPIAIGSVAKTMTAYVILKNHPLKKGEKGPMIDVDKAAVEDGKKDSEGESTVNTLKEGDKITEYDALAAIMIPSANNVARLLARWDTGGDQEAFVKKMNDTAKELGMTNTTYTDPSGLDATTVSTAEDQVKLGLKVVEMPELIAITKLVSWVDPYGKSWPNWNHLIPGNGALGIKTGSTTKAGGNLLFAAEKKVGKTNQLIVGAVLGQHGVPILDTAIAASKSLMLATQKSLVNATVVKKGDTVGYVDDGLGGHTPVVATADVEAVGWPSLSVALKLGTGDAKLPQTAKAGTEVGVLTVGEGASQVKVPVALKSDLAAPGLGAKLTRVG